MGTNYPQGGLLPSPPAFTEFALDILEVAFLDLPSFDPEFALDNLEVVL